MANLRHRLSEFCRLEPDDITRLADRAPNTYKKYYIAKKKGGRRRIEHPSKETKLLQYALMQILAPSLLPHEAAYGFVRGLKSPLCENANKHKEHSYFLKMDIEDFFPSIGPNDVIAALRRPTNPVSFSPTNDECELITKSLFVRVPEGGWGLPIGGVASPMLSNGAMYALDEKFESLATGSDFTYSRYADDLVFSTDRKNASEGLLKKVKRILKTEKAPSLRLNSKKTKFMSRNCRIAITGLIITPDRSISIGRKNKRKLKSLVNSFKNGCMGDEDRKYLQGYLAFLLDVEPDYYNRLCHKYGAETIRQASKRV